MAGFSPSTWTPVHGWAGSGSIYSTAVHGYRFAVAETDKVGSFDELRQLLHAGRPSDCSYCGHLERCRGRRRRHAGPGFVEVPFC